MFSGGRQIEGYSPPAGVDFVQLPAIRWDSSVDAFPVPVDPRYTTTEIEHMRSELLVDSYLRIRPRIVITEHFPFSARRWGKALNELFVTIHEEREKPIVICSIRAYPRMRDGDAAWINKQLHDNFSCVLHHADPKLFPLTSLGPSRQTALSGVPVQQTGFIRRPINHMDHDRRSKGLLLTVGGGSAFGASLLKRWINAARAGSPDLFPINAVCGPLMGPEDRRTIHAEQGPKITVYDWVTNMDELIGSSRAVVCMGGYNTLVEALGLNRPVLAFPNSEHGDQTFQVNALHAQGMLLKANHLQSESEITALMNELLKFRPQRLIDCDGADRSVEIVKYLLSAS
jgi:predicted glycosyltransferase